MKRIYLLWALLAIVALSCKKNTLTDEPTLMWNSEESVYNTDVGGSVFVVAEIVASEGLNTVGIDIPAWSAEGSASSDILEITGSPRKYNLKYEINVSDDAEIGEHTVRFTLNDYAGNSVMKEVTVNVQSDKVAPEITIVSPEDGVEVEPEGTVTFELTAKDDLKMKNVVISCPELKVEEVFVPDTDEKTVAVNYGYKIAAESGEYVFTIKATDNQLNSIEETRTVKVLLSSKPRIEYLDSHPVCGVSGGTMPFRFRISTNEDHPVRNIRIVCSALSIDETVTPDGQVWTYDMDYAVNIDSQTPGQRNLDFKVIASNDLDETSEYKGSLNVFDKMYAIGRGTLAKEKEGQAIPMGKSVEDPNKFELVTWINAVGEGVKFLSEKSWNDYNWGLDSEGNIVSPDSDFIKTETTGYYRFTFDPTTWEYTAEPVDISFEPETGQLYLNGNSFFYWDEDAEQWTRQDNWDGLIPFKRHPENSNCFYIDVKTGPEGSNVALWKIAGQPDMNASPGLFYGINSTEDENNGEHWDYHWWEYIGPYYKYDSKSKVSFFREDGRKDTVMRLTVDLYLGYMSWMSLKEQVEAGWNVYPPLYTPYE